MGINLFKGTQLKQWDPQFIFFPVKTPTVGKRSIFCIFSEYGNALRCNNLWRVVFKYFPIQCSNAIIEEYQKIYAQVDLCLEPKIVVSSVQTRIPGIWTLYKAQVI